MPRDPSIPINPVKGSKNFARYGMVPISSKNLMNTTTGKITLKRTQKMLEVSVTILRSIF